MSNIELIKQSSKERNRTNNPQYQNALINMRFDFFSQKDIDFFITYYQTTKDLFIRNQILQAFVLQGLQFDLEDFFLVASKKERYLDMKLTAIRGYSSYTHEKNLIPIMDKFDKSLSKKSETTPYNYQEYEMLRSEFGLPYLVEKYGYECFIKSNALLKNLYDNLPELCKGFFTLDKNGMYVPLATDEEITKRLDKLFKENMNK